MAKLSLPIPLRWSDLDAYGHVNNAKMLTLLEEARIKAFWASDQGTPGGVDPDLLAATKILTGGTTITLVAGQRIEYLKPLQWTGEDLRVDLWLGKIGGASLEVSYEVFAADGSLVARSTTAMVTVNADTGAPVRISDEQRERLSVLLEDPVQFRR